MQEKQGAIPKNYRARIILALKRKDFVIKTNYRLSSAQVDSVEFTLTLTTLSLTPSAKKTQVNTVVKALTEEFGSKAKSKKDQTKIPNFTVENTAHMNVVSINLLRAFKVEHPNVEVTAEGKIPVEVTENFLGMKKIRRRSKKKLEKALTFSAQELNKPKRVPILPLEHKMLSSVVGKLPEGKNFSLKYFLDNFCEIYSVGKINLYRTKVVEALEYLKRVKGNRKLKESHVRKLMRSYIRDGFHDRIMYINDLLEIIDGQHGIEAARRLGMNIIFAVAPGWGKKEVAILNVNSESWTLKDFMHMYAEEGNPNYVDFRAFFETHYFDITTCQILITNKRSGGRTGDAFREGKLLITHNQLIKAQRIAKEAEALQVCHPRGCFKRNFVQALQLLHKDHKFDSSLLIQKMQSKKDKHFFNEKPLSISEYLDIFVKKYNADLRPSEQIERPVYPQVVA